jgi:hypothetical protein
MLIAAMVGLDTRTTMDIDATLRGMPLTEETVRDALAHIVALDVDDNVTVMLKSITHIREDDVYGGYRASITASLTPLKPRLKSTSPQGTKLPRERFPIALR